MGLSIVKSLWSRPRLLASSVIGIIVFLVLPSFILSSNATRLIIAWDTMMMVYLGSCAYIMMHASKESISARAHQQIEGKWFILSLVIVTGTVGLLSIAFELAVVKDLKGSMKLLHITLTAVTIVLSWVFTQTMFALHYAHDYYVAKAKGLPAGLDFPNEESPDYGDFMYFAFVIGTSGQTADVAFSSKAMRRVGLLHCVLAYFFNATVLALTINIAAGLIGT